MWVSGRIVQRRIDAVDDSCEAVAAASQKAVQAFAEVLVLNLPGVGTAHRCEVIGVDDAPLHEINRVMIFKIAVIKILPIQPENVGHDLLRENSLILEIMNRKNGADGTEKLPSRKTVL